MIIFTNHALLKLKQRSLTKEKVIQTIENPDEIMLTYGDRNVILKKFGKLHLKVVFRKEGKDTVIITQHWITKI
jgi:hypothetical protein